MLPLLLGLAIGAPPLDTARYTTVFRETVDGKPSEQRFVETALIAKLEKAGLRFIDEAQSRKIRSVTDAGRLIDGTIPEVISSLDADVILAGVVQLTRTESELLGDEAARYSALIQSRAIAVDTGEVIGVFSSRGTGLNFSPDRAAEAAAIQAADAIAGEMLAKLPKAIEPSIVELSISGVPDVAAGRAIEEAIRAMEGIEQVVVLHAGRGESKLSLRSKMDAGALALALDEAGNGLTVFGYAKRSIRAEYSLARALRLRLAVGAFAGPELRRGRALAELIATSLANSPLLSVPAEVEPIAPGSDRDRTLVLSGSFAVRRDRVEASASLAARGQKIATAAASCDEIALSTCAAKLGEALVERLPGALGERLRLFDRSAKKPLRVSWSSTADLFPSRAPSYARAGLGEVVLENLGAQPIESLSIAAEIPGFATAPMERTIDALAPKAKVSIPVPLVIDKAALARHHESRPAALLLGFDYRYEGYRVRQRHSRATTLFHKNAMSWAEERAIASFVTHGEPAVLELAKRASNAVRSEDRGDPIALPAALFAAMSNLSYARDPEHPYSGKALDWVWYPREMLALQSGDCDDLSVLYAALAEAAGLRAILLTTPGHILVAIDSGLPERNRRMISIDPSLTFVHQGRAFIPVETTRAGKPFREAWRAAALELAKHRARPIDLREAWRDHPPFDLATDRKAAPIADLERKVAEAVAAEQLAHREELERALKESATLDEKALLFAIAERLKEAERAYAETLEKKRTAHRLNNLGNVRLIDGDPRAALEEYRRALAKADSVPIHINAALAAWLLGDEELFSEHIASCLAIGGERAVAELSASDLGSMGSMQRARSDERRGIVRRYLYWL